MQRIRRYEAPAIESPLKGLILFFAIPSFFFLVIWLIGALIDPTVLLTKYYAASIAILAGIGTLAPFVWQIYVFCRFKLLFQPPTKPEC